LHQKSLRGPTRLKVFETGIHKSLSQVIMLHFGVANSVFIINFTAFFSKKCWLEKKYGLCTMINH